MNLLTFNNKLPLWFIILIVILIKVFGIFFALSVFSKYTPLIDSTNYINEYYINTLEFRTLSVQLFAKWLKEIGGIFFAHFIFAMVSAIGFFYYYITGGRHISLIAILFFPSSLVWGSIVGKEAIFIGFFGVVLVIWSRFCVVKLNLSEIFIVIVSLVICFLFRPHYAVGLAWLFVSAFVLSYFNKKSTFILCLLLIVGGVLAYLMVWDELAFRGYSSIDSEAKASRFNLFKITPNQEYIHIGFKEFKEWLPLGLIIGILGPMPMEVYQRFEFLPFFCEGLLVMVSPILIYKFLINNDLNKNLKFKRYLIWCILPAIFILMIFHAPFGLLNPGSSIRWRTNFEAIFYMAPILLIYAFVDNAPNENCSFPS